MSMDFDAKYNEFNKKSNTFLQISKWCGGIGFAFIVCCVFQLAFSLIPLFAVVCFVPAGICFFIADRYFKAAESLRKEHYEKVIANKEAEYESNRIIAQEGYSVICAKMEKPEVTYKVNVLDFGTVQELNEHQSQGEYWKDCLRECECWLDIKSEEFGIGAFCFIESYESFDKKVRQIPSFYSSLEEAAAQVWRRYIPFHDIISYEIVGDILQTSKFSGGNATYRGVTVNGIGFGEIEYAPIEIEQKNHDNRVIALSYYDGTEETILMPCESLGILQTLIPQFER